MKKIVLISPNKNAVSETFISAHKECINGEIVFLYGSIMNLLDEDDKSIERYMSKPSRYWKLLRAHIYHHLFKSYYPRSKDVLVNFLKKINASLVLAEYGTTGADIWEACKEANVPLIIHFHGFDASHRPTLEKYLPLYKKAFEYASYVIGVSKQMCHKLIEFGAQPEKVIYNPCGPQEFFFDIKPDYNSPNFFAVGRFVDKKAPYLTLLAFKKIKEKFKEANLIMAGTGGLLNTCINLSNYYKLDVQFLGTVSHWQVKELFSNSFCFLQHSIESLDGDSEGTPVAVLEAQAAGLPVVSTFHAGIPDVVVNGKTGFLVKEQDVDAMADKMLFLYQNRELAKQMGTCAREHIKANLSLKIHIDKINDLIDKAIQRHKNI